VGAVSPWVYIPLDVIVLAFMVYGALLAWVMRK
jgi:hypothetical protein